MSASELTRLEVMQRLQDGRLSQREAAAQLGIGTRQVKRIWRAYKRGGVDALASKRRGQPSNHQLSRATQEQAVNLLGSRYRDFGPTFAHEKLTEEHGLRLSVESTRRLMMESGLWQPRRAARAVIHPPRDRRLRRGELVQADGSPFDWFEGRAPVCSLLVFIDDATSEIMHLRFAAAETTFAYMEAVRAYLEIHGKPLAWYTDKLGVFRINAEAAVETTGATQFGRAMEELDIQIICANSPQAKGRVERANQTLQDRLTKELRLRGISTIEEANAFLPEYIEDFNPRFAVAPQCADDAHRPLRPCDDLQRILTVAYVRTLSKNLTLQYNRKVYAIETNRAAYTLRGAQVIVREDAGRNLTIEYKGRNLKFTTCRQQSLQADIVPRKELQEQLKMKETKMKGHTPASTHPWRKSYKTHEQLSHTNP